MRRSAPCSRRGWTHASPATAEPPRAAGRAGGAGLSYIPKASLASLNAVFVPAGVDDARVRARLLAEFGIEIGGGLGPFKGKAWRIGLMGASSTRRNVTLLLGALETLLRDGGWRLSPGAGLEAAAASYAAATATPDRRSLGPRA